MSTNSSNRGTNALVRTARTFLLCDKQNTPFVRFRLITLPKRYIVIDTKILDGAAKEILGICDEAMEDVDEPVIYLNAMLTLYLSKQRRDYKVSGYQLDDFIIKTLELNPAVTNFGRLSGMEYLIDLLHYHFYDSRNELYVTCEEPGTIAFFHEVPCWDRLFVDAPITYEDIRDIKTEDYNYVSIS